MTNYNVSRRDFLLRASMFSAGLLVTPPFRFEQQSPVDIIINEAANSPVTVEPLRNNVSLLTGSGGNMGVFNGKSGKLIIDAGIDLSKEKILHALAGISPAPIEYLINTHWHFDHTSGNEWLNSEGATILAHVNTRNNLSKKIRVREWDHTFPSAPEGALPTIVFNEKHALEYNGVPLKMQHMPNAHTDSDISVHFEDADILFMGDVWWNGFYPFIDADTNGNIYGIIAAVNANLEKVSSDSIIIPGHGPRGTKKQLEEYRDMLVNIADEIRELKQSGLSIKKAVLAKPTQSYDAKYGNSIVNGDWFANLVYKGV